VSFQSLSYSTCFAAVIAASCWGASPAIGIATASGHFTLEKSQVWGNSTLFEGSTVETGVASLQLALQNGVRVQLGSDSRARVWNNRVLFEKGVGQVASAESYEVQAGGLTIHSTGAGARIRIGLAPDGRVDVTALAGGARVMGAGLVLATIPGGRGMSFPMQASAAGSVTRAGCVLFKDGYVLLQDDDTREVIELLGSGLNPNVGNRAEVRGTASAVKPALSIATSILNVTAITQKEQGGCLSVAAALDARTDIPAGAGGTAGQGANTAATAASKTAAATTAGTAAGGGMSTGAKIAIVAAIAGGGGGAALAVLSSKKSTSP
jgi:hypothetical protein